MLSLKVEGGNQVYYRLLNGRMLEIYTDSNSVMENIEEETNRILSVSVGDFAIKIGDYFQHEREEIPSSYYVEEIMRGGSKSHFKRAYTIRSYKRNKGTNYILPCLGNDYLFFDTNDYLINSYLNIDFTRLYLLYRFSKTEYYSKIESRLVNHPRFVTTDSSIPGFDIFIFNIPEEHQEDAKLFMKGKYSKLSDNLKFDIKSFYKLTNNSFIWKVLTKDPKLIAQMETKFGLTKIFHSIDLDEIPDPNEEIWERFIKNFK